MNSQHRAIRAKISDMCKARAIDYISAFCLPEDEEKFIIEREINKLSIVAIAGKYNTSREYVRDCRRMGFSRIADAIEYENEKGRG